MGSRKLATLVIMVFMVPICMAFTCFTDVRAINELYVSLGSPSLTEWRPFGGDPCGDQWQGVYCDFLHITGIRLNGTGLKGTLGYSLGDFGSIRVMDFSNNSIVGNIPSNLPLTIQNLSLAGNQLVGSIPFTLSFQYELLELALNDNFLSGQIPDSFEQLPNLINLDMSGNNFNGPLPLSLQNLRSLKTLNLQNNNLSGSLDVLQDLSLTNLNVEHNLFSGNIPANLLNIPNFKKDGNHFNEAPPAHMNKPPPAPTNKPPSNMLTSAGASNIGTTHTTIIIIVMGVVILLLLGLCVSVRKFCQHRKTKENSISYEIEKQSYPIGGKMGKAPYEPVMKPVDGFQSKNRNVGLNAKPRGQVIDVAKINGSKNVELKQLQPPPVFSHFSVDEAAKVPAAPIEVVSFSLGRIRGSSVTVFSVRMLQQYTDSFSAQSFIGEGLLGSVYRAELPNGEILAVKKLNKTSRQQSNDDFLKFVSNISKLRHDNILELEGYCNEHGKKLLVYKYCENGSLHDALHVKNEICKQLSWTARVQIALGAARALQYLHVVCDPPIVHKNFKSANILLDEKLSVHVSDCGLAPLLSSCCPSQISGHSAIEDASGNCTCQSDVYSFGLVMLELLTGRKSFDRERPRGEQSLARWAIPQLHYIDALWKMIDPALNRDIPDKSLSRFADIISRCVQSEPEFRPLISEIVQDLSQMI